MSSTGAALAQGEQLLRELKGEAPSGLKAPTMGLLKKCSYTHDAMIDLIIEHPDWTQGKLAAHFGYSESWFSNILAADAFQNRMAVRREEIINPELKASIEERFRALVIRSLEVLQNKLNATQVSDNVAIRAAELGAKALGIGGNAVVPPKPSPDRLLHLAERLKALNAPPPTERILNAEDGAVLEVAKG